jgi:hypothetical protein
MESVPLATLKVFFYKIEAFFKTFALMLKDGGFLPFDFKIQKK